jgi:hypothetical protein
MRDQGHDIEAGRAAPTATVPQGEPLARAARMALTDTWARLRQPASALVLATGVLVIGLSGPFGTWADLSLPVRVAYWAIAIGVPAALQSWLSFLIWRLTGWAPPRVGLAAGLAGALPVWAFILVMETALPFPAPMTALQLLPAVGVPLIAVTVLVNLIAPARPVSEPVPPGPIPRTPAGGDGAAPMAARPGARFLERLPPRLGRTLVCVQAQGHYLEVTTRLGRTIILLPISQAEVELAGLPGIRVHRSWWVSLPEVRRVIVQSGRMELELAPPETGGEGRRVPVARAMVRRVRVALDRYGSPDLRG